MYIICILLIFWKSSVKYLIAVTLTLRRYIVRCIMQILLILKRNSRRCVIWTSPEKNGVKCMCKAIIFTLGGYSVRWIVHILLIIRINGERCVTLALLTKEGYNVTCIIYSLLILWRSSSRKAYHERKQCEMYNTNIAIIKRNCGKCVYLRRNIPCNF